MTLGEISDLIKGTVDINWYNKAFQLQQFVRGVYDPTGSDSGTPSPTLALGGHWLPRYARSQNRLSSRGIANHALVNTRIMVQGVVFGRPDFDFPDIFDGLHREIINQWLAVRWDVGNWRAQLQKAGMIGYEPCGIGIVQVGIRSYLNHRGKAERITKIKAVDPCDFVWDNTKDTPDEWEWAASRSLITRNEFIQKYGPALALSGRDPGEVFAGHRTASSNSLMDTVGLVEEWEFYTPYSHCTIFGGEAGEMFAWDDEKAGYVTATECGPNPFGMIPYAAWLDMLLDPNGHPTGKAESTWAIVSAMNKIEKRLFSNMDNNPALTWVNASRVSDPDTLEALQSQHGDKWDLVYGKPFLTKGTLENAIGRIPGMPVDQGGLQLLNLYSGLLSGLTGADDASRGQRVGGQGERITATEVSRIADRSGVQLRHMMSSYADFLSQIALKAIRIGAKFDDASYDFMAAGYEIDKDVNVQALLDIPSRVVVTESSLQYMSKDQREMKETQKLLQTELPFVQLGVLDASKVWSAFTRRIGRIDGEDLFLDEPQGMPPGSAPGAEGDLAAKMSGQAMNSALNEQPL